MAQKTVILHIGGPKVASTYIQRLLVLNPAALASAGAIHPVVDETPGMPGNGKLIPMVLNGAPQTVFRRFFPEVDIAAIDPADFVQRLVHRNLERADTVILSGENFRPHHAAPLKALLPRDVEVKIVLLGRRQDSWLQSYYTQTLKHRLLSGSISEFMAGPWHSGSDTHFWPDWHQHHLAWRAVYGQCTTLIYDEIRADLFGRFLAAAGLTVTAPITDLPPQNTSLSLFETALLQNLAPDLPLEAFLARRKAAMRVAREFPENPAKYDLLSEKNRAGLQRRFAASNNALLAALGSEASRPHLAIRSSAPGYVDPDEVLQTEAYRRFTARVEDKLAQG
ncbi:MAG: hypothetical protein ACU0A9_13005 [Alterinioella nitratireducens]|uniref:hypothetical protein n=1 Tax=Alterinioella nitratireducens TaxID=2735915 RepID=UPI0040583F03